MLHILKGPQKLGEYLILDSRRPGRQRWQIFVDGNDTACFARVDQAVEAVDYEVSERGPAIDASARPEAEWRRLLVSEAQVQALSALRPPQRAATKGEAVLRLAWAKYARRR